MSESSDDVFEVFFSWQSDLPEESNTSVIRSAINLATVALNEDAALNVTVMRDEASRDLLGSTRIAEALFGKIRNAQAFVCDISKIHESLTGNGKIRSFCNPNVLIELGYAIMALGWERIILVVNTRFGNLVGDIPFDIRGQAILTFECESELNVSDYGRLDKQGIEQKLGVEIASVLSRIIRVNPKRPVDECDMNEIARRHKDDVTQLEKVLQCIHLQTMNRFIDRILNHARITNAGQLMFERFQACHSDVEFYLYDRDIDAKLNHFAGAWSACFRHAYAMQQLDNGNEVRFEFSHFDPDDSQKKRLWSKELSACADPLFEALKILVAHLKERFPECDLDGAGAVVFEEIKKEDIEMTALKKSMRELEIMDLGTAEGVAP